MAKKLQLSIPEPCHENWDAMTPVEKGRFCGSCQKQVVDFSNMSDRQVAEFFKKPATGSVCGRFMTDQLERDIDIPKKRIPWFKYFFQFALPAFLVSIKASAQTSPKEKINTASSRPVTGDTTVMPEIVVMSLPPASKPDKTAILKALSGNISFEEIKKAKQKDIRSALEGKVAGPVVAQTHTASTLDIAKTRDLSIPAPVNLSNGLTGRAGLLHVVVSDTSKRTISGVVTDEKGDPVPGATVVIKGTRIGTPTDTNARFRILAKAGNILMATSSGYEPAEVTVGNSNTISLAMRRISMTGTEVVVMVGAVSSSYYGWHKKEKPKKEIVAEVITGKVMTEKGDPVPGASITIKGSKTGVAANINGEFSIKAKRKDVIRFSSTGHEMKEITVKDQKEIIVYLRTIVQGGVSFVKVKKKKDLKNVAVIPEIKCSNESAFKIFPNPVEAGTNLNIEPQKQEEGYYTIELLNQSGQSIHQQEIWIDADQKQLSITIPQTTAGNYFIVMTNRKTGKKFTEKIIIQ